MCGIAGILGTRDRPVDTAVLGRMAQALRHRGPDEEGFYRAGRVGLAHRRLSIIDLSTGHQPLGNEDGTVWVVFNGEIYNFQELRPRLEAAGHRFATGSDTEVIVHAYEEYGLDCLGHFRGMFAFALWDGRRQRLVLARDRVGKKPLFYGTAGGQFVFASELQGLVQHPELGRDIDPAAVDEFLTYGYIPAPRTIFRGVWKLPPAHSLVIDCGPDADGVPAPRVERYWELHYQPKLQLDEDEAAEALLERLTEAVRLRLVADVPLGALLSGGVDSSLVVALMSRLSGKAVKTFSIGFPEQEYNELPYAALVARHCGTEHHELVVRPSALEVLPLLVRHYGEPYADSSAVPSYYVAKMTREHVTVALNGDGGDESFAGYERYLGSDLADRYQRLPWLVRRGVIRPLAGLIPESLPRRNRLRRAKRLVTQAELPRARRYLNWVGIFTAEQRRELYAADFAERLGGHEAERWLLGRFEEVSADAAAHLDSLLAVDVRSYLPYDLLVKMDIATMATSLEARSPLLDHEVMEFAARLPPRDKIRGTTLKYLLKKVAGGLVPAEVLGRRKMGFGVPVGAWMRGELRPLVEDVLLSGRALGRGYFRPEAVGRLVRGHLDGSHDHADRLWALLWLELWHREFLP